MSEAAGMLFYRATIAQNRKEQKYIAVSLLSVSIVSINLKVDEYGKVESNHQEDFQ